MKKSILIGIVEFSSDINLVEIDPGRSAGSDGGVNMAESTSGNYSQEMSEFAFEMDLPAEILEILSQGKHFEQV